MKNDIPEMTSLSCSAHTLQLAIKDAFKEALEVVKTLNKNHRIVQFFKKSQPGLKLLHATQQKSGNPELNLKQKVATRWNSEWISTERLIQVQQDLKLGK